MISLALTALSVAVSQASPLTQQWNAGNVVNGSEVFGDTSSSNVSALTGWAKTPFEIPLEGNDNVYMNFIHAYEDHPELTDAAITMFATPIRNLKTISPNLPGPDDFHVFHEPDKQPYCSCISPNPRNPIRWNAGTTIKFMETLQDAIEKNKFREYKFNLYDRRKSQGGWIAHCKFKKDKPPMLDVMDPSDFEDGQPGTFNITGLDP